MTKHKDISPKISVFKTYEEMSQAAADGVISQVDAKPDSRIIFPTGNTPKGMYKYLVAAYKAGKVSFKELVTFNLDEYWPMDPSSKDSYASFMKRHLFDHIDIPDDQWHIPNGAAADADAEAERYEKLVTSEQVDLAVLGLGPALTCHLGFNEPGSAFKSVTRKVKLSSDTIETNKKLFADDNKFVETAITQGLGTILKAKKIMLLVNGEKKSAGVERFLTGDIGEDIPASCLRTRSNVEVLLDTAAYPFK